MALCRTCSKPIPCHCHLRTAREVAPGVYLAGEARDRAADRAAVLRWAAAHLDTSKRLRDYTDDHMADIHEAANELRRLADEAAAAERQDEGRP